MLYKHSLSFFFVVFFSPFFLHSLCTSVFGVPHIYIHTHTERPTPSIFFFFYVNVRLLFPTAMERLWTWGVFNTNPFIDFSTTWVEPVIQRAVDVTRKIEPDLLYTLAYIAVIGVAYLFHSPFRAHSAAATDTYGRLTKVCQTWTTVVFFCFHLGPQFFRSKQSQLQQARNENEAVPILYFPLFAAFNLLFSFLHKMKRRWGLGVTYGGRLSLIGLNSLILAAVGTVHYAYCSTLYENSPNRFLKAFLYSLTPAPVVLYPFRCVAKLIVLSCCFVAADYQYKKWLGFDPSRGILWSELYELRKLPRDAMSAAEQSAKCEKKDWRECVAPPRVYAPATRAATSSLRPAVAAASAGSTSYTYSDPASFEPLSYVSRQPTTNFSAVSVATPTRAATTSNTANPAGAGAPLLRPRVLYHECPPDVDMNLVESWFDVDDAALQRVCGSTAATLPPSLPPPSFAAQRPSTGLSPTTVPLGGLIGTTVHDVDHADPTLHTVMSFRAPRFFIEEAQVAQHPINRPGMVPWWSTFVLFTAWQTVASATLRFLAFDVRTIQGFTTPKIFHLHFTPSLKRAVASAAECADGKAAGLATVLHSAAAATSFDDPSTLAPGTDTNMTDATVNEDSNRDKARSSGPGDPLDARRPTATPAAAADAAATTTETANDVEEEEAAAAEVEAKEPDVWFDWIADVGDGFNPTYSMARLLAQPSLSLPAASTGKKKRRRLWKLQHQDREDVSQAPSDTRSGALSTRSTLHTAASETTSLGDCHANSNNTGPTSPFLCPSLPFPAERSGTYDNTTAEGGRDDDGEEEEEETETAGAESRSARSETTPAQTPPLSPPLPALPTTNNADPGTPGGEVKRIAQLLGMDTASNERGGDDNDSVHGREAVSASYARWAPRLQSILTSSRQLKTAASRVLLGGTIEKGGCVALPRGSFVVVGGDLAYPSPDDDTYTTRLFEPYNDALGGNLRLQRVFHVEQQRIVVADRHDVDVAHIHMLDAQTVADVVSGRGGLGVGRGTAEEALRSVPLLFAIPGNHDWFDGLTTYRKYILERTWIGGWLMPQRSSFFVIRLPYNWFMLCGDTGNTQDIDVSQRNYFLDVIERYMDAESCVILAAHEPGWLFDAMEREDKPRQPELNRVVEALGTRLRLRLAGDIHNYSRHVPRDPSSQAATLVVSGGGGAFMHGARKDPVISQGTRYVRACAFPSRMTFTNMASRLWGFRVVNWKFDLVVGFLCFTILLSVLPLPVEAEFQSTPSRKVSLKPVSVAHVFSLWVAYATSITSHVVAKGIICIPPILFFWMCFSTAGSDRHATLRWRLCYGAVWTFAVLLCCSGAMALIHVQILYLLHNGFLYSSEGRWNSVMESQAKVMFSTFSTHAWQILGGEQHRVARAFASLQNFAAQVTPLRWLPVVLRCIDPFETFAFLSTKVSSGVMGVFADDVSRLQIMIYYIYVLFFYWTVITPVVSMLIGLFLLISVTSFDYMYDGTYSAFQVEDYKHFIRFRLDAKTRQLHAYVIAMQKPAKVYELDRKYLSSLTEAGMEEHRPPHLKQNPSRWAPMQNERRRRKPVAEILEHFTVHPHRVPQPV